MCQPRFIYWTHSQFLSFLPICQIWCDRRCWWSSGSLGLGRVDMYSYLGSTRVSKNVSYKSITFFFLESPSAEKGFSWFIISNFVLSIFLFHVHRWPVRTLSFSYDGNYLASGSEDLFIDIVSIFFRIIFRDLFMFRALHLSPIHLTIWLTDRFFLSYSLMSLPVSLFIV